MLLIQSVDFFVSVVDIVVGGMLLCVSDLVVSIFCHKKNEKPREVQVSFEMSSIAAVSVTAELSEMFPS